MFIQLFIFLNFISVRAYYPETVHSCSSINKHLQSYIITWTHQLVSSQYKEQKNFCEQSQSSATCCTNEIFDAYASNIHNDLQKLLDTEFIHLSRIYSVAKQQTNVWSKEYLIEARRLVVSSLETLFGTQEYRLNMHESLVNLFNTLNNTQSSVDDVSRSINEFFNRLIVSVYRTYMLNSNQTKVFDQDIEKCLVNKAFDIDIFPMQKELLYILTSASSLMQIFRTLFIYVDVDIQRLNSVENIDTKSCLLEYAKDSLCPICSNHREILCENTCQLIIRTCLNQTKTSYLNFASMAKGYSSIIKEIEQAVIELKLVERLSKLHIYFYDMIVNASNSRRLYGQIQRFCPNKNMKTFSPILSLPPTIVERREVVTRWNRTIHSLFKQLHLTLENLEHYSKEKISFELCSNPAYASKSQFCTENKNHFIQWQFSTMPEIRLNPDHAEQTRNQIDDLKTKMSHIQQIILSFRPKKKISFGEFIPDFDVYTDDIEIDNDVDDQQFLSVIEIDDSPYQGSLSDRIYRELDGQTTGKPIATTQGKNLLSNSSLLTSNTIVYLILLLIIKSISL